MNFGELIYQQPENIKKLIRKIENLEKKLANARVAILFNKTWLNIYIYIICFMFYRYTWKASSGSGTWHPRYSAAQWIRNWLTRRRQGVCINETFSSWNASFPQRVFRLTPGNTGLPSVGFFVSLTATCVTRCYPVAIETRLLCYPH